MAAEDSAQTDAAQSTDRNRINPVVFFGSSALIIALSVWAIITPDGAANAIGTVVGWISTGFGWYYFLAATLFLIFVVYIALSRYGTVKLGPQHSRPAYSIFAWGAMLFAAGIGIDLMFFSVAGPVTHYLAPPEGDPETIEAARQAIAWTLFHYGITGWAMYALMGMALGYFAFRYRLPLSIRSALYPIVGKRIYGGIGNTVDLAAVIGTIFGIAVSLGIGVIQLNFGLNFMFDIPIGTAAQIGLIVVAVLMATASAVAGVDKGIRRLSELNVILAIGLMLYIVIWDDPIRLLNSWVLNIGDYVSRFPGMTLNTFAYEQPTEWLGDWTLFFWAWWIAWAPFVGLFLARISRGRTIRQFVAATLIIPFLFTLTFLSIFGNTALGLIRGGNAEFGETAMNAPEEGFYTLLAQYPGVTFSAGLATFVGLLFYVTSADSGALVMGNFTSRLATPTTDASRWVRIFWAAATGLLTMAMLLVGGLGALTSATIIMGLPFSFVMFLVMWGLYKALRVERLREDAARASMSASLSERTGGEPLGPGRTWRQRIARAMTYPGRRAVDRFIEESARPAFADVAEEIRTQGGDATVLEEPVKPFDVPHLELRVSMGQEEDFAYCIWPEEHPTPSIAPLAVGAVGATETTYYRFGVYLNEGSQGYDVMGYSRAQLIGDILDQYERHLEFLRLHRESANASVLPEHGLPASDARPDDQPI
uniref:choline BCCT transporter BetT n=1 Tax=Hoyosella subflava TaxID=639313 RepID=UPI00178C3B18|nr:choline BCCT transporter BetT [Hoyosella subflava]